MFQSNSLGAVLFRALEDALDGIVHGRDWKGHVELGAAARGLGEAVVGRSRLHLGHNAVHAHTVEHRVLAFATARRTTIITTTLGVVKREVSSGTCTWRFAGAARFAGQDRPHRAKVRLARLQHVHQQRVRRRYRHALGLRLRGCHVRTQVHFDLSIFAFHRYFVTIRRNLNQKPQSATTTI